MQSLKHQLLANSRYETITNTQNKPIKQKHQSLQNVHAAQQKTEACPQADTAIRTPRIAYLCPLTPFILLWHFDLHLHFSLRSR